MSIKNITWVLLCLLLTACGFQLRGSQINSIQNQQSIQVVLNVTNTNQAHLTKKIKQQLLVSGTKVTFKTNKAQPNIPINGQIQLGVNNIYLRKHQLVGKLSEIQLLLTADIQLKKTKTSQNKPSGWKTRARRIEVQRSYQYNQESVSSNKQQERHIIDIMQQEMAEKITQQVFLFNKS